MPLLLSVSCFRKIQIGFTFLVPAHPCNPRQRAVKPVCVWVCACVRVRTNKHRQVAVFTSARIVAVKELFKCLPSASHTHRHRTVDEADQTQLATVTKLSTAISACLLKYATDTGVGPFRCSLYTIIHTYTHYFKHYLNSVLGLDFVFLFCLGYHPHCVLCVSLDQFSLCIILLLFCCPGFSFFSTKLKNKSENECMNLLEKQISKTSIRLDTKIRLYMTV